MQDGDGAARVPGVPDLVAVVGDGLAQRRHLAARERMKGGGGGDGERARARAPRHRRCGRKVARGATGGGVTRGQLRPLPPPLPAGLA